MTSATTTDLTDLTVRRTSLDSLVALLRRQQDRKQDAVVPAARLRARGGLLEIDDLGQPRITPDGVTSTPGRFAMTGTCENGLSAKLHIPRQYLRLMRTEGEIALYDANINTWLATGPGKKYLVRTLRQPEGGTGIARALLSDSYRFVDNYDVLLAVLAGIADTRTDVTVSTCDLTERRMYVKITAPRVTTDAPALLHNYRSPFTGASGADCPVVAAGAIITNSEVGEGAFTITPQLTVQVCRNGMTMTHDAMRSVHIGQQLDDGVIQWSDATRRTALELVTAKARDPYGPSSTWTT